MDKLARHYPLDHTVILYEAATNLEKTRIDKILLRDLPTANMVGTTTLVIPAAYPLKRDEAIIAQLNALPEAPLLETV